MFFEEENQECVRVTRRKEKVLACIKRVIFQENKTKKFAQCQRLIRRDLWSLKTNIAEHYKKEIDIKKVTESDTVEQFLGDLAIYVPTGLKRNTPKHETIISTCSTNGTFTVEDDEILPNDKPRLAVKGIPTPPSQPTTAVATTAVANTGVANIEVVTID